MAHFKPLADDPLADDGELSELLNDFSRTCELVAVAAMRTHQYDKDSPELTKALDRCEQANVKRQAARKALCTLISVRISKAYNAGVNDGVANTLRR